MDRNPINLFPLSPGLTLSRYFLHHPHLRPNQRNVNFLLEGPLNKGVRSLTDGTFPVMEDPVVPGSSVS